MCRGGVSGVVMGGGCAASGGGVAHNGVSEFRPKKKGRTIKAVTRVAGGGPHSSLSAEGFLEGCAGCRAGSEARAGPSDGGDKPTLGGRQVSTRPCLISPAPLRPAPPGRTSPQGR